MTSERVIGAWLAGLAIWAVLLVGLAAMPQREAPAFAGDRVIELDRPADAVRQDLPAYDNGVHYWIEDREEPRPIGLGGVPSA